MKKQAKIITSILAIVVVCVCCISLAACDLSALSAKQINMFNVELSSEQYAFIFKKSADTLKEPVNAVLKDKKEQIDAIKDKYLNATSDQLSAFGSADIKTTPSGIDNEFVVATNIDFAPFEYYNGSKIAGIDIEIAQLIADELGKTLVVVHMDFDAVVTAVETKDEFDIGMAALTISEDRAQIVNFSDPYFDTTQVLIARAAAVTPFDYCSSKAEFENALASLKGAKIGGQVGTTGQQYVYGNESLGFAGYKNVEFSGFESPGLAVQSMLNGNIDYVIVDKAIAINLLKNFNK